MALAVSSRGTKCRGDLVHIPAGTVRDCFAALANDTKGDFHLSWPVPPVTIAVKIDLATQKKTSKLSSRGAQRCGIAKKLSYVSSRGTKCRGNRLTSMFAEPMG